VSQANRPDRGSDNAPHAGGISPTSLRIEATTSCQLACPSCPTARGIIKSDLGTGFLRVATLRDILDQAPEVQHVELSNYGELFLNPELVELLIEAHRRGVALTANNGVNFNHAPRHVLEALVEYEFRSLVCSIDGTTQESDAAYRRGGNLANVLANIRLLNQLKAARSAVYPALRWQFVVFGHNEHQLEDAKRMAEELGMQLFFKLSWDETFSPVRDGPRVEAQTGLPASSRSDHERRFGAPYMGSLCQQLWRQPQLNWDGRVLGCCVNHWGDYGNALTDGLQNALNGERMKLARQMLMGTAPPRSDIPCASCGHYKRIAATGSWLDPCG